MSAARLPNRLLAYAFLLIGAVIFIIPFLFMVVSSVKPIDELHVIPITFFPRHIRLQNYVDAFTVQPMAHYFLNSTIVTSLTVVGMVISCSLAGWGFSRSYFWGRNVLFLLVLSTMMIPSQVTLIPVYLIFTNLHWISTFLPLTVPAFFAVQPYNIFLIRQFALSLPEELSEAAVIDGCSPPRIFWSIGVPLIRPAIVTVAVFTCVFSWSDFFQPLIYLNSNSLYTVALGLTAYQSEGFVRWDQLMPASTVAILPVLLVFLFFQRYFVKGLAATGLKE